MRDFDYLLPRILTRASQVPEPTAIAAIREATIELCEKARSWAQEQDIAVPTGISEVLIPIPVGALLHELASVTYEGKPLKALTIAQFDERFQPSDPIEGPPRYYSQRSLGTLLLAPSIGDYTVRVRAYLKPTEAAEGAPEDVLDQHSETIAHGALARLLTIPGQPWSNPNLASYHEAKFIEKTDHLQTRDYLQGQQRAPLRTKPQFL